jgi:hypothetical protein
MPFIPTNTKYVVNGRVMGGTMRRRVAKRTWLLPATAAAAAETAETPAVPLPEDEEEDLPPAKKPRLQAPNSVSTAAVDGVVHERTRGCEKVTTDDTPAGDIPTYPVTPTAPLSSAAASRAPRRFWKPEEGTKLTEAVK